MPDELDFYSSPGPMTRLDGLDDWIDIDAGDPAAVAEAVQGLIVHNFWAEAYGREAPAWDTPDLHIRSATAMVETMVERDPRPCSRTRPVEDRYVGNCRHFTTLSTALLRHAGIPARARCGFASYFERGKWVDHWIIEWWDGERWVQLDAQIDALQQEATGLDDPHDLKSGHFVSGGEAWRAVRAGQADGDAFGIHDMWGDWFIPGNVARDLASLNKVEMLPWDGWGSLAGLDDPERDLVDEISAITVEGDLVTLRQTYARDGLTVPDQVWSYVFEKMTLVPELAS